ncbi:MAG: hypothetical protein OQL08_03735 [Gammaproteobacteria bacterium]|nr:hypothetical protein [Gammaproteobacteria bacterium]
MYTFRHALLRALISALLLTPLTGTLSQVVAAERELPLLRKPTAQRLERPPMRSVEPSQPAEPEETQPEAPQGGNGVYVMDGVDFHPLGGGEIPGLGWNNKVPVTGYYRYQNHSFVIVTGTVHGDGLISGPGQDGWTFVVKLDTNSIIGPRPAGCQFSIANRAQTAANATAWKYQIMIVFNDTATKPECFDYFKSLQERPFPVRLVDIVGPYWTGDKQYQEPRERLFRTGPVLSVHDNHAGGHMAVPW